MAHLPEGALSESALAQLFLDARTHRVWHPRPVEDETLHTLHELVQRGPTAVNSVPMRVVFVKSEAAKAKLIPTLDAGNVEKTRTAPVTALIAYDVDFHELLPKLAPGRDMRSIFANQSVEERAASAAMNATLQTAYLILAARALGLDCGPMSGFDRAKADAAFFAGTSWRAHLLVNLGHGDGRTLFPRAPRLSFDEACRIE